MLTRLAARAGGVSPHSSSMSVSVETIWPAFRSKQARAARHLDAPIEVQPCSV
ncbi:MAG TPA: hypothetical protein VGN41_20070 [Streptosporangiaceae bacterium]